MLKNIRENSGNLADARENHENIREMFVFVSSVN